MKLAQSLSGIESRQAIEGIHNVAVNIRRGEILRKRFHATGVVDLLCGGAECREAHYLAALSDRSAFQPEGTVWGRLPSIPDDYIAMPLSP